MAKNSLNLIQVENTREGIEKLADLLLVATENITYMQYKLSSQMFGGNSDVIEIRFGDCVEYVSRIIMEADARRRDELLLRIAKIPFAPLRLVLLRRYFEMQYKNPFLHFQEEVAFRTYVAMSEKRKKKRIGKNIQEYLQQKSGYIAAMCVQESNGLLLYEMLKEGLADGTGIFRDVKIESHAFEDCKSGNIINDDDVVNFCYDAFKDFHGIANLPRLDGGGHVLGHILMDYQYDIPDYIKAISNAADFSGKAIRISDASLLYNIKTAYAPSKIELRGDKFNIIEIINVMRNFRLESLEILDDNPYLKTIDGILYAERRPDA